MTILAAIGLDELARAIPSRPRLASVTAGAVVIVASAALAARPLARELGGGFSRHPYLAGSAAWGAVVVLAVACAAVVRDPRARAALAALLVAGDSLVLFALPHASAPRNVRLDLEPVRFLQRHLGTSRFFTLGPLQPNYGSYFGIGSLNVNDVPVPSAYTTYVHARLDAAVDPMVFVGNEGGGRPASAPSPTHELLRNLAAYRAAAVAYVLTPADQALPTSRTAFRLVFRSPSTRIYRLAGAAPYFTASNPACAVRIETRESVRLSCPSRVLLVRRETDLRGWSVDVDGHQAHVERTNDLFQGVTVAGGTHRVTFRYSPPYIGWGYAALAAGCGSLLAGIVGRRRLSDQRSASTARRASPSQRPPP
jgi:hypothetical protein